MGKECAARSSQIQYLHRRGTVGRLLSYLQGDIEDVFQTMFQIARFSPPQIENVGRTVLILRELHRNVNFPVMVQYRLEVLKGEKVRECFR